jgi:hypothetical protein
MDLEAFQLQSLESETLEWHHRGNKAPTMEAVVRKKEGRTGEAKEVPHDVGEIRSTKRMRYAVLCWRILKRKRTATGLFLI